MKKTIQSIFALALTFTVGTAVAQELPAPSPMAEVEQKIGLTDVEVEYSRPGAKDREVWGDLVPYDQLWRAGANKATAIEFSSDVVIGGVDVKEGKYALFILPYKGKAEVILNSKTESWGTGDYDEANNVASFEADFTDVEIETESMLFYFDNVKSGSADLILTWAGKSIIMPIEVDYIEASIENINKAVKEDAENFRVFNNAAGFYLDNNIDAKKALEYAKKSVELDAKFWNVKTLSEAYAANGDYKNAVKTAKKSLQLAEEANYGPYIKMNNANIDAWSKM